MQLTNFVKLTINGPQHNKDKKLESPVRRDTQVLNKTGKLTADIVESSLSTISSILVVNDSTSSSNENKLADNDIKQSVDLISTISTKVSFTDQEAANKTTQVTSKILASVNSFAKSVTSALKVNQNVTIPKEDIKRLKIISVFGCSLSIIGAFVTIVLYIYFWRSGLKGVCGLLPILGLTWVFGIFSVNQDLIIFQYLFAVFNSLQGLFIFLFYVALNPQKRNKTLKSVKVQLMEQDNNNCYSSCYCDVYGIWDFTDLSYCAENDFDSLEQELDAIYAEMEDGLTIPTTISNAINSTLSGIKKNSRNGSSSGGLNRTLQILSRIVTLANESDSINEESFFGSVDNILSTRNNDA
uniref:G-protein coupled receptors family 2 profile 2 domain-containing protein n=1 Tax=Magallana gigas TaxID=29159 RepID=K1PIM8_MAGGI